ncbi:DUF6300 family protein [Nonomuraea purpurea]|uniref:DUF6300 family protein n=1 Tax=Nonomuraea purpurea TaxID=1849276 RepID=A0ABV8FYN3_9ACTN
MICPRCRADDVLAVLRRPHTWTDASGGQVRGVREIVLCARCDAGDPLVSFFAVHGTATKETAAELAGHLRRWIDRTQL